MNTPGPWKLETESRSLDGSDLIITDSDGGYSVATCIVGSTGVADAEEAKANARLIAAAPTLADVLSDLFRLIEDGTLVRNVEGDLQSNYLPVTLNLVTTLKRAQDSLRAAGKLP